MTGFHQIKASVTTKLCTQKYARTAYRFRSDQPCEGDATKRRCGQRADRPLRLFRQRENYNSSRACYGEWGNTTRLSAYRDRRGTMLGRRTILQHAARVHGGLLSAAQPLGL